MDDLDRLFHRLVSVLTEQDPAALRTPLQVSEIYQSILPYRIYKRQLELDTNEDYEMAVLRLLAGERGYASIEPAEARDVLNREARSINPNPAAFRQYAAATVRLSQSAAQTVLRSEQSYAPPVPQPPQVAETSPPADPPGLPPMPAERTVEPVTPASASRVDTTRDEAGDHCPHCNEELPPERQVTFCPFCGGRIGSIACTNCGSEIELGWRYCITCGHSSPDG